MHYFYGARAIDEVFFLEDFLELEKEFPNFHFHLALDRPDPKADALGVKYTPGFIAPVMGDTYLKQHDAPEDIEYYLCGPPMMSKTVLDLLHSLGVEDDMIMFDNFGGICEQIRSIFSQRRRPNLADKSAEVPNQGSQKVRDFLGRGRSAASQTRQASFILQATSDEVVGFSRLRNRIA